MFLNNTSINNQAYSWHFALRLFLSLALLIFVEPAFAEDGEPNWPVGRGRFHGWYFSEDCTPTSNPHVLASNDKVSLKWESTGQLALYQNPYVDPPALPIWSSNTAGKGKILCKNTYGDFYISSSTAKGSGGKTGGGTILWKNYELGLVRK